MGISQPGGGGVSGTTDHTELSNVTANQHHPELHAHSGADASGTVEHAALTGQTADDHHPQLHGSAHEFGQADALLSDQPAGIPSLRSLGSGSTQAAAGDHPHTIQTLGGAMSGELGGTPAAMTVDSMHSGSSHANLPGSAQVAGDTIVTLTAAQTLTGKTLTSPVIAVGATGTGIGPAAGQIAAGDHTHAGDALTGVPGGELGGTWAAPTVDATHSGSTHANLPAGAQLAGVPIVTTNAGQTLTNKTLTAPVINTGVTGTAVGTGAGQIAAGDHTHGGGGGAHAADHEPGGVDPIDVDAAAGVGSLRTLGTGALQAAAGTHGHAVQKTGALVGTRPTYNYIDGSGITVTVADNPGSNRVDVTVAATGSVTPADIVPGDFYIHMNGATCTAVNLKTGATDFSSATVATPINQALAAVVVNTNSTAQSGGLVWLGSYDFTVNSPIIVHDSNSGAGLWLRGSGRRRSTLIRQGTNFGTFTIGAGGDAEVVPHGLVEVGETGFLPQGAIVSDFGLYGHAAWSYANSSGLLIHGSDISVDHIFAGFFEDYGIFLWGENNSSGKCFSIHTRSCYVSLARNAAYGTTGINSNALQWASDLLFHDDLAEGDSDIRQSAGGTTVVPNMVGFYIRTGTVFMDQCHAWFPGLYAFQHAAPGNLAMNSVAESCGSHCVYGSSASFSYEFNWIGGNCYRADVDGNATGIADIRCEARDTRIVNVNHFPAGWSVERPIWVSGDNGQVCGNYQFTGAGTEVGILLNGGDDGLCATNYIATGPTYAIAIAGTGDDNFVVNNYLGNGQIHDQYGGGTGNRNQLFDNYAVGTATVNGTETRYRDENGNGRWVNVTAAYTVRLSDRYVTVTGAGAAFNVTLPSAVTAGAGHLITIKRAGATNNITVVGTIDGAANFLLDGTRETITVLSNATDWHVIHHYTN